MIFNFAPRGYIKIVIKLIFVVICVRQIESFETRQKLLPEFRKYIVASVLNKPFLSLRSNASFYKGKYKYEGFCIDLLEKISTKFGFNYEIQLVNDSNYGVRQSNGHWNGIIGEILSKRADLSCADLTITNQRSKVVQFTQPFMHSGITLFTKKPKTVHINASLLFKPFTSKLWCLIVTIYTLLTIASFIVSRIRLIDTRNKLHRNSGTIKKLLDLIIADEYQMKHATIVSQSLITFLWYLITLFVVSVYIASLLHALNSIKTDRKNLLQLQSIKELSNQNKYKYAMIANSATETFFKHSTKREYKNIYETVKRNKLFVSSKSDGVRKLRSTDDHFVLIMEKIMTKYSDSGLIDCDLISLDRATIAERGYGLATQIGSHLGLMLNQVLLDLEADNFLDELKEKWWNNHICHDNKLSLSVEWDTIYGFTLILIAIFVSIIVFSVFEHRFRTQRYFNVNDDENKILMVTSNGHNGHNGPLSNHTENDNDDNKEEIEFASIKP